jgi:hypothetical protein
VEAANNLYAGLTGLDRDRILHNPKIPSLLSAVVDEELAEIREGGDWEAVKASVRPLLAEFVSIPNVDLAKATGVLHLKRPHLLPILNSFVVKFLTGNDMENNVFFQDEQLHIGLVCFEAARTDITNNFAAFAELRERLSDLPTPLTTVRMYDILCWTEQKWVRDNDPSAKYRSAVRSLDQSQRQAEHLPESVSRESVIKPPVEGEIRTTKEFRRIVGRAEGVIVITGTSPPRVHRTLCPLVTDDRFNENVVINQGKGGRYYWRSSLAEARRDFAAVACKRCDPGGLMDRRSDSHRF